MTSSTRWHPTPNSGAYPGMQLSRMVPLGSLLKRESAKTSQRYISADAGEHAILNGQCAPSVTGIFTEAFSGLTGSERIDVARNSFRLPVPETQQTSLTPSLARSSTSAGIVKHASIAFIAAVTVGSFTPGWCCPEVFVRNGAGVVDPESHVAQVSETPVSTDPVNDRPCIGGPNGNLNGQVKIVVLE